MEVYRPERVLAFSDAVFGVAITLLVIDLRLPEMPRDADDAAMMKALLAMGQPVFVFVFTFAVVGLSWVGHHRKFSLVERVDERLIWLNLVYLLALCLVPFASSTLGAHGESRIAFALYAGVMAFTDVLSAAVSVYAIRVPFAAAQTVARRGLRTAMIGAPLLGGLLFALSATVALAGWVRLAHWTLLVIIPAMSTLGRWARRLQSMAA